MVQSLLIVRKTTLPVDDAYIKINDYEYSRLEYKDHPNLIITRGSKEQSIKVNCIQVKM